MQIEKGYHNRIGNSNNNFSNTFTEENSTLVNNTVKDPYIFDFITLRDDYKEKELEFSMLEKIRDVLLELGKGFSLLVISIKFLQKIMIIILIYYFIT